MDSYLQSRYSLQHRLFVGGSVIVGSLPVSCLSTIQLKGKKAPVTNGTASKQKADKNQGKKVGTTNGTAPVKRNNSSKSLACLCVCVCVCVSYPSRQ